MIKTKDWQVCLSVYHYFIYFNIIDFILGEEFLKEVKQLVGKDISDEEFNPPRKAFNILATEYDLLVSEVDDIKVSLFKFEFIFIIGCSLG